MHAPRRAGRESRARSTVLSPGLAATAWLAVAALVAGCGGRAPTAVATPNQLPHAQLTAAPKGGTATSFVVQLAWSAFDPDGQVVRFVYALDPPLAGDTAWTTTQAHALTLTVPAEIPPNPLTPPGQYVVASNAHTFVLRAIDNHGGASPVVARSFTATTVAPETRIETPPPAREVPVGTLGQVTIRWTGEDPDGATRHTPVVYKYRMVVARAIQPDAPNNMPSEARVQAFFGADWANGFATWDSTTETPGSFQATGLAAGTIYIFAVVARDEAGAYEPRFVLGTNVIGLKPSLANLGPAITVSNQFFTQTQRIGGVSLAPARIFDMESPPGVVLHCTWSAAPTQGANLAGYRWALDMPGGDIADETPRANDADLRHWSNWAGSETSADIGPFAGSLDTTTTHFLYVEAEDQIGFLSLFTLRIRIVVAQFDRPLLVIDDMYGSLNPPTVTTPYPSEAEQDTFHFAVGGVPDRLVGGISRPGAFAGFDYDTLDYRASGLQAGIPLSLLGHYRVVAWYTDNFSVGQGTAIGYINTPGHLNALAAYVAQGGKAFLFGEGMPLAIATAAVVSPVLPYGSSPAAPRSEVLKPGCFLYDAMHLRSEINTAGTVSAITRSEQLQGAIPYLPAFAGAATATDRSHDPRIGPSAARTAARWECLPRLTIAAYRNANPDPTLRAINQTWYVSRPLFVTEGQGAMTASVLDTLYLLQARDYSLDGGGALSDGKPDAIDYHGSDNGEVVWLGFPLYDFELDQARQLVRTVLGVLGVAPRSAALHVGPGHATVRR